jgi:hypothetical protein
MAQFRPTCRQCFMEKGISILLEERNGELVCPKNPNHKTVDDVLVCG